MEFKLNATDKASSARSGTIITSRGILETPVFMPVGTVGTVKTVHQKELEEVVDAGIILGNTYHLYLRPGIEVLEKAGGLHKFIGWNRHMLTDSGGYQVYSLTDIRKLTEEGVTFQSHIDGSKHFFSPEKAIDLQRSIGADFIMAFDECTPYPCDYSYAKKSLDLTRRWLDRCFEQMDRTRPLYGHDQYLFPIVQGSVYKDLRIQAAQDIAQTSAPGIAIGGLSVGEPKEQLYEMTQTVCENLPQEKPRYLMGVGTPEDLLECIARGIDMFDCVLPTRNARHGILYTPEGIINIKNKKWEFEFSPINENRLSFIDDYYSRAYLRHLFKANEFLAAQIASLNNLTFFLWLVREARKNIENGTFSSWKKIMVEKVTRRL